MKNLTIYLTGPIKGLPQKESLQWKMDFNDKYSNSFEVKWPQQNDLRHGDKSGRELYEAIALDERLDILNSDAVIAYLFNDIESMGTSMGIMYAYLSGRTVVVVTSQPDRLSKLVNYHCHFVCDSLDKAVDYIINRHNRKSISSMIKRNGSRTNWNPDRILSAIQKAIYNVFGTDLSKLTIYPAKAEKITEAVVMKLEDDIEKGLLDKDNVHIESVQDSVEKVLMSNTHREEIKDLVKAYIIYRKKQDDKRNHEELDKQVNEFIENVLHHIKGFVGNIGRECSALDELLLEQQNPDLVEAVSDIKTNQSELWKYVMFEARDECKQRFLIDDIYLNTFIIKITRLFDKYAVFHIDLPPNICIRVTPYKLKSVIHVLINNSIKHGFKNVSGNVYINAYVVNTYDIVINYYNDGADITSTESDCIFSGYSKNGTSESDSWKHGLREAHNYIYQLGGTITCAPIDITDVSSMNDIANMKTVNQGKPWFCIILRNVVTECNMAKKILVADDSSYDRKSLVKILRINNVEILEASTIHEAVDILANNNIYAALIDLDFKEEMNGLWLLKHMREKYDIKKIMMISGKDSHISESCNWRYEAESLGAHTLDKSSYTSSDIKNYLDL